MSDMPDEVPVLTASDMCIGPMTRGKCGCLLHWYEQVFVGDMKARQALCDAHDQLQTSVSQDERTLIGCFATDFEDERRLSRSLAARVWNRAMAILGYTVGNPECVRGKLKPVKKR